MTDRVYWNRWMLSNAGSKRRRTVTEIGCPHCRVFPGIFFAGGEYHGPGKAGSYHGGGNNRSRCRYSLGFVYRSRTHRPLAYSDRHMAHAENRPRVASSPTIRRSGHSAIRSSDNQITRPVAPRHTRFLPERRLYPLCGYVFIRLPGAIKRVLLPAFLLDQAPAYDGFVAGVKDRRPVDAAPPDRH